jgi:hypothetical protein
MKKDLREDRINNAAVLVLKQAFSFIRHSILLPRTKALKSAPAMSVASCLAASGPRYCSVNAAEMPVRSAQYLMPIVSQTTPVAGEKRYFENFLPFGAAAAGLLLAPLLALS